MFRQTLRRFPEVATACFSCSPPVLNSSKLNTVLLTSAIIFPNYALAIKGEKGKVVPVLN
jgi:hypothetical protein